MSWESEVKKREIEERHVKNEGRDYIASWPNEYPENGPKKIELSIRVYPKDKQVIITPYVFEELRNEVEIEYPTSRITMLLAGIRDDKEVTYLGKYWNHADAPNQRRVAQYFFEGEKPAGVNLGNLQSPTWPLNMPPFLDDQLTAYFAELSEIRPLAASSLRNAIQLLSRAGPEYGQDDDGSISFRIPIRRPSV